MSQGSAAVLPIGIVFAAGAAVVVAAVSAAVLVAYAANQAAVGALRVVGRTGAALEAESEAQCEADREALRWQAAAADAVGLNARLRMAAAQAHRLGVPADIPPPLDLTGRRREEVMDWATRAERRLAVVQQTFDASAADARRGRLMAGLPITADAVPDTARALAAYQACLHATRVVHEPRPPDVADEVTAVLARVDPDAMPAEQEAVLRAALFTRSQENADDADAHLVALRRLVDKEIRGKAEGRRQAACWLQALELPAVAAAAGTDPRPPFSGTAARLLAVVDGTSELTDDLRDEGRRAAAWAAEVTRREFLRDRLLQLLADGEYEVDLEVESAWGIRLRTARAGWDGEHSALLFIANDGAVTGRLARHLPGSGDEARLRDKERCGDLHAVLHEICSPTSGVTVDVDVDQPPVIAYSQDAGGQTPTIEQTKPRTRTHG